MCVHVVQDERNVCFGQLGALGPQGLGWRRTSTSQLQWNESGRPMLGAGDSHGRGGQVSCEGRHSISHTLMHPEHRAGVVEPPVFMCASLELGRGKSPKDGSCTCQAPRAAHRVYFATGIFTLKETLVLFKPLDRIMLSASSYGLCWHPRNMSNMHRGLSCTP